MLQMYTLCSVNCYRH